MKCVSYPKIIIRNSIGHTEKNQLWHSNFFLLFFGALEFDFFVTDSSQQCMLEQLELIYTNYTINK